MKKIGYLIIILSTLTTQLFAQSTPPPPDYSVSVRQVGVSGPVKIKIEEGTFSSTYDYPVFIAGVPVVLEP